jgi:hypothetical protein
MRYTSTFFVALLLCAIVACADRLTANNLPSHFSSEQSQRLAGLSDEALAIFDRTLQRVYVDVDEAAHVSIDRSGRFILEDKLSGLPDELLNATFEASLGRVRRELVSEQQAERYTSSGRGCVVWMCCLVCCCWHTPRESAPGVAVFATFDPPPLRAAHPPQPSWKQKHFISRL